MDNNFVFLLSCMIFSSAMGAFFYHKWLRQKPVKQRKPIKGKWIFEQTVFHCTHPDVSWVGLMGSVGIGSFSMSVDVRLKNGTNKRFYAYSRSDDGSFEPDTEEKLFKLAEDYLDTLIIGTYMGESLEAWVMAQPACSNPDPGFFYFRYKDAACYGKKIIVPGKVGLTVYPCYNVDSIGEGAGNPVTLFFKGE